MNPMTNVKNIQKLNDRMLSMEVEDDISWHKQYKDSAYIFIGGLPYDLTEGDILCVFSQYGEIVDINLVRDKATGKTKGFGFLCYENQKSTILAVDNFNGIKLGGRTIRVDHVSDYKRPKGDEKDENGERIELPLVTCAPKTPPTSGEEREDVENVKERKKKKEKLKKKTKNDDSKLKTNDFSEAKSRAREENINKRSNDMRYTKETKSRYSERSGEKSSKYEIEDIRINKREYNNDTEERFDDWRFKKSASSERKLGRR